MTLETFFEKFDLFADAPDAVARMRSLILRLAMQGNLSGPHKADGPIEDLLRKIKEERAAFGIKDSSSAKNSGIEGGTFNDIPSRWSWVPFGTLARHNAGKTLDKGRNSGELRDYITTSNLYWGFFQLDDVRQMPIEDNELEHCTATKGDLLIVEGGEAGRAAVWPHDYDICFQNHIHRARLFGGIDPYFVQRYFEKLNATGEIARFRKGVGISNMSGRALASIPIALPPLAEQKRIVAKVDELMALCDQLEAQQQERKTRHAALARASLARFADAPTPANLNFLFHKSYDITPADLRKSILTLAVQGKLVPQDPNDEPAERLIERVSAALPNRKAENPFLGPIDASITDETEYELPHGWAWLPLGHVGIWATGCGFPTQYQGEPNNEFLFCKVSDMNLPGNEVEIRTTVHTIDAEVMKKIRARANPVGTVIFPKIGGAIATHKRRLVIKPTIIDNNCSGIQPIGLTDHRWLLLFLRNLDLTKYQSGTSVPAVSQGALDPIRIGLPPLAEQKRIVAKVDQLMALVDELEQQLTASRAAGEKLLAALVAELTVSN